MSPLLPNSLRFFYERKAEGFMYCGTVEFVCAPSAVRHIPVLLDECMAHLGPEKGGSFADLTLVVVVIAGDFRGKFREFSRCNGL